jgi:hypothetical protein
VVNMVIGIKKIVRNNFYFTENQMYSLKHK